MAWCSRCGTISGAGSTRPSVASTLCKWACDHAAKSIVVAAVITLEILEDAVLEHLDLLLGVGERALAVLEQLRASLVSSQRALERQLPLFHARYDFLELGQGGFQGRRRIGFLRLGHGADRPGGR